MFLLETRSIFFYFPDYRKISHSILFANIRVYLVIYIFKITYYILIFKSKILHNGKIKHIFATSYVIGKFKNMLLNYVMVFMNGNFLESC